MKKMMLCSLCLLLSVIILAQPPQHDGLPKPAPVAEQSIRFHTFRKDLMPPRREGSPQGEAPAPSTNF